jgi:hypothetical protein
MQKRNPRRSYKRDVLWKRVRSLGMPCHVCGLPIDYSLPARHPLSYELDEIVPVSKGGDPASMSNCAAAHRCCNQWKADKTPAAVEEVRAKARSLGQWKDPLSFCELARHVSRKAGAAGIPPIKRPKKSSGI